MPTENDNIPDDERIPVDLEDDETVTDPQGESDDSGEDEAGDDDTTDEGEGADDDAGGAEPQRVESRGNRQMGALRAETRRLAEENARITRQLDEMRRQPAQPAAPLETPAQRAERLALLSPEDRVAEIMDERLRAHEQRQQQLNNQILDQSDSAAFKARIANNPVLRKLEPEVERRLADLRSRGQNLPRDVVATYLIGERALAQLTDKKPGGNRQERRRNNGARPVRAGGDVQSDRQERRRGADTASDLERRFGDVPI